MEMTGASILTREQLTLLPKYRLDCGNKNYWLQPDTTNTTNLIPFISSYGDDNNYQDYPTNKHFVRPIIFISGSMIGYRFKFGGVTFSVVADDFALCDDVIDYIAFGDENCTTYENSTIKTYVDEWYNEHKTSLKKTKNDLISYVDAYSEYEEKRIVRDIFPFIYQGLFDGKTHRNIPYQCSWQPNGTIDENGCGVCAFVAALSYYTQREWILDDSSSYLDEVAAIGNWDLTEANKWRLNYNVQEWHTSIGRLCDDYYSDIMVCIEQFESATSPETIDEEHKERVLSFLRQGYLIECSMNPNRSAYWTSSGHYVLLTNYDSTNEKIYVHNSSYNEKHHWINQDIVLDCIKFYAVLGPGSGQSERITTLVNQGGTCVSSAYTRTKTDSSYDTFTITFTLDEGYSYSAISGVAIKDEEETAIPGNAFSRNNNIITVNCQLEGNLSITIYTTKGSGSDEFIYLYDELENAELLDISKSKELPEYMLDIGNKQYWLKDVNTSNNANQYVGSYGDIQSNGLFPDHKLYVRPLINFKETYTGIPKQQFIFDNKIFTTINSTFGIAEDIIGISQYDSNQNISYDDSEIKEYIDNWFNSVEPPTPSKEIVSISVTAPAKLIYQIDEEFDKTGFKCLANYSDGSSEDVTEYATISGFDSSTVGTKTITVSYWTFTSTFTISVQEEPVEEYHTVAQLNELSASITLNILATFARKIKAMHNILPSVVLAQTQAEAGDGSWQYKSDIAINGNNFLGMDTSLNNDTWSAYTVWDGVSKIYVGTRPFRAYSYAENCIQDYMAWQSKGDYFAKDYFNPNGETDYVKCACKCAYHYTPASISVNGKNLFNTLGEPWQPLNWRGVSSTPPSDPQRLDFYMLPWSSGGYCYVYCWDQWNQLGSSYLGSICNIIDTYNLTQFDS